MSTELIVAAARLEAPNGAGLKVAQPIIERRDATGEWRRALLCGDGCLLVLWAGAVVGAWGNPAAPYTESRDLVPALFWATLTTLLLGCKLLTERARYSAAAAACCRVTAWVAAGYWFALLVFLASSGVPSLSWAFVPIMAVLDNRLYSRHCPKQGCSKNGQAE